MDGFKQGRLLRIFIDENDRHGIQPMYTAVVEFLRAKNVAGATVFRGIEGYGSHQQIHVAKVFSWIPNLPILIEVVDDADKIDAILPELETLIREGLITLEAAEYLLLRKHRPQDDPSRASISR
jgi:PII-like signaling protein